jgi:hypothetical protein
MLKEEHRLRVFENRVLRRICGAKRDDVRGNGGSCTVRNFIVCTHPQISLGESRRMSWAGHVARMGEERKVYKVLVGKPEERDHLEDQGVGAKMGSEWILGRLACGVWIGFDWLRPGTGGGLWRVR